MDEIRIVLVPLPASIKAYTVRKDDYYTIVLNCNLSLEQNKESYQHELKHILQGDFDRKCHADLIELFTH